MSTETLQTTWQEATDTNGVATHEFIVERDRKRSVTGALWLPPQPHPGGPLMLCGHGASGNRYQAPISHLADRFVHEMGIAVLSLDGPVHGLRQVGPGGRDAFWPEWKREGCIDDMTEDWQVAIATARAVDEVGQGQLAYFGLSMGSIFGVPLVASRDDVVVATHPSLDKFPIYAALGVPEVWRYAGQQIFIYRLVDGAYLEVEASTALPGVMAERLTEWVLTGLELTRLAWIRRLRAWAETLVDAG